MRLLQNLAMMLGRFSISAIFIYAGVGKIIGWEGTTQYMAAKGMPMTPLLLMLAAACQILGGVSVALGYRTRLGSIILLLFLIPVSYIFHDFWNAEGEMRTMQMIMFLKNLSIFGGLLYVLSVGPGDFAVDACCKRG